MNKQLFENNLRAHLRADIGSTTTNLLITLVSGEWPYVIATGEYLCLTLSGLTEDRVEIVHATRLTPEGTLTVVRGRESTAPQTWSVDDTLITGRLTAATLRQFLTLEDLPDGGNGGGGDPHDGIPLTDPRAWGAKCIFNEVANVATIPVGSTTLTLSEPLLSAADVGKCCVVQAAGLYGDGLRGDILSVESPTSATLSNPAESLISTYMAGYTPEARGTFMWYTNDMVPLRQAWDACETLKQPLTLGSFTYPIRVDSAVPAWRTGETVSVNTRRFASFNIYEATTAGVCGATKPIHSSGTVSDGGVSWRFVRTDLANFSPGEKKSLLITDLGGCGIIGVDARLSRVVFDDPRNNVWGSINFFGGVGIEQPNRAKDVVLRDFTFRGTFHLHGFAVHPPTSTNPDPGDQLEENQQLTINHIRGSQFAVPKSLENFSLHRVRVEFVRAQMIWTQSCMNVVMDGCELWHGAAGGLLTAGSDYVRVTNNRIAFNDDDAILAGPKEDIYEMEESGTRTTATGNVVITGNTLMCGAGIKVLGNNAVIANNSGFFNFRHCVFVKGAGTAHIPGIGISGIVVSNNSFINFCNREVLGSKGGGNSAFWIGSASLGDIPGDNDTVTGGFFPYYGRAAEYVSDDIAPLFGVVIDGNTLTRTAKTGVNWADFKFGPNEHMSKGEAFFWNPDHVEGVFDINAFHIGGRVRGLRISNNVVTGAKTILNCPQSATEGPYNDFTTETVISGNIFQDFKVGIYAFGGSGLADGVLNIKFEHNRWDMDTLHTSPGRTDTGGWTSRSDAVMFDTNGEIGLSFVGDTFANCSAITNHTTQDSLTFTFRDCFVEAYPVAVGFNVGNQGVGRIPAPSPSFTIIPTYYNPKLANYKRTVSNTLQASPTMPTSGYYLLGRFVHAAGITRKSGRLLIGWLRLTTGSTHVLGTDWNDVYAIEGSVIEQAPGKAYTVADDSVISFAIPSANQFAQLNVMARHNSNNYYWHGLVRSNNLVPIAVGTATTAASGVLTGTTGVDGAFTVSIDVNTVYVENRIGVSLPVIVNIIGGD